MLATITVPAPALRTYIEARGSVEELHNMADTGLASLRKVIGETLHHKEDYILPGQ